MALRPTEPVGEAEGLIHEGSQFRKILRHGSWYFAGSLLTKVLSGFLLLPVYTRYLSPEQYGVFGTLDSVAKLVPIFISLYLDTAFIRFYYHERSESLERVRLLYSTHFWFVLTWGGAMTAVGLTLSAVTLSPLLDVPFAPFMPLVFASPLLLQLALMGSQYFRANLRAREISVIQVAGFLLGTTTTLVLLIGLDAGILALLWGAMVTSLVPFAVFTTYAVRKRLLVRRFDRAIIRRSLLYSLPLLPNVAGGWIAGFSDRIVIASLGTTTDVGLYTVGYQLAFLLFVAQDAIGQVQTPIGISALTADRVAGKRQIADFISVFVWGIAVAFLALSLFAREIIRLLLAADFEDAWTVVALLALTRVLSGLYRPFSLIPMFHRKLWVISTAAILAALLNLGLNLAFVPEFGRFAAAAATVASTGAYLAWVWWFAQRIDRIPLDLGVIGWTAVLAAVTFGAAVLVDVFQPGGPVPSALLKLALLGGFVAGSLALPALAPVRGRAFALWREARLRLPGFASG